MIVYMIVMKVYDCIYDCYEGVCIRDSMGEVYDCIYDCYESV